MEEPRETHKPRRRITLTRVVSRDAIIFFVGLGGIVNETFFRSGERPTLILLFAAMIGLPAFLHLDEKRNKGE